MFENEARRAVLEGVNARFEGGKKALQDRDLREISEEAGLSPEAGKRLLGRLISPDGPIVGEPITGNRLGLMGIIVEDVHL